MQLISFVSAATATAGLFVASSAAANIKGVFCHYLVQTISQDHAETNVKQAKAAGFDALALDLFSATNEYSKGTVEYLFNAAKDQGMKLFFSLDMTPDNLGSDSSQPSDFLGLVKQYASRDEYYKVDNRPFLSTFNGADKTFGQDNSNDGWKSIFAQNGLTPYWVPDFDQGKPYPDNFFDQFPDVDGAFAWETAWPSVTDTPVGVSDSQDQRTLGQAQAKGKVYMMPWSSLQYKHLSSLYQYRIGELNYADRISQILSTQPDYVEFITWNDAGESHYIGSVWPEELNNTQGHQIEQYTDGFDHTGWQQMLPAVIQAMKGGVQDVSGIFPTGSANIQGAVWYRSILKDSPCDGGDSAKPAGWKGAQDAVNYAFLLPEGSSGNYVKVFSNGQQLGDNIAAGAGLNKGTVLGLQTGAVRVEVWDVYGGSPIAYVDGSMSVGNEGGSVCNFNYVVDALVSNR